MTERETICASMTEGRWMTTAEVQRAVAKAARDIWPRRHLSLRLGLMAKDGLIERERVGKDCIFRRTA